MITPVARAHLALACVACLFGGLNVVLEVGLHHHDATTRSKIGRASVFALYRDIGAQAVLLSVSLARGAWRQPGVWAWLRDRRLCCCSKERCTG